jgi:hypothetical protein
MQPVLYLKCRTQKFINMAFITFLLLLFCFVFLLLSDLLYADTCALRRVTGILDNSGIRMLLTPKLRQHDVGSLIVSHSVTPYQVIPPREPAFVTSGYCTEKCINKVVTNTWFVHYAHRKRNWGVGWGWGRSGSHPILVILVTYF